MEVLLDTNFIVSCILKRIDFLEELKNLGFTPILPREVFQELKDLQNKVSHAERAAIDVAFEIFEKEKIKKAKIGGINVDDGLIAKGKAGIYIATLDAGIKNKVPNLVLISNSKNGLSVERK